ncbi:MAG: hypothetical protein JHD02_07275 [Thermoleophilaceae bacterium]|nr:hypothetical protein [Thermoleophilaceae bacterium]
MHRSSLKCVLILVVLCAIAPAATASGAAKSCAPDSVEKLLLHKHGVQVYAKRVSQGASTVHIGAYACSNTFRKRLRIERLFQFEAESFSLFRTNGRYLFYKREFIGPLTAANYSSGRLLDLKTGNSMRKVATRTTVDANVSPMCANVCRRNIHGATIGPRHSFVIGFDVVLPLTEDGVMPPLPSDAPSSVIEMHCPSANLSRDRTVVLDRNLNQLELMSLKSDGIRATWTDEGKRRSAKFC